MLEYDIRHADIKDIDLIVESIIAAERSGSDVLSYTSIFGLNESETECYIRMMLEEEIDGCELSLSSYLIAEKNNKQVAVMGAWVEGKEGVSSATIKGNLLSYTLPKGAILKAKEISPIISEMSIEYIPNSLCIGIVYVKEEYRGRNLVSILLNEHIRIALTNNKGLEVCIQVFGNNTAAIKSYIKLGFKEYEVVNSDNEEVNFFLPSNIKILLKKNIKS